MIDREGKIASEDGEAFALSHNEQDPAAVAEVEEQYIAIMQRRFESAGDEWPPAEGLSEEQQRAILIRVDLLYTCQQIEAALKANPGGD